MSDNTGDESIFTKFKNLVSYKINNAVSDPNAEKYAAERAKNKEEKEKQLAAAKINTTVDTNKSNPNQFNAKRFFNKIINETTRIIRIIFFPFVALMLAMIVANEMIIYTVPIRIIFFIFTFLVCCFMTPLCIILGFYYILKGAYSYYINNMTDRTDKVIIMPTIYALLPITMYKPESSFLRFFYYPFTYPKSAISEAEIPKTMEAYWKELNESFKDLDKVKNLPIFSKQLEKIETKLLKLLHDLSQSNSTTTTTTTNKLNIASVAPVVTVAPVATVATVAPVTAPVAIPVAIPK